MSLRTLNLTKAYSSDIDDIVGSFYVPSLSESIQYDRLAGFFSSTSLAIAARGIVGLIKNGGHLRLVASPRFTKEDIDIISEVPEKLDGHLTTVMLSELEKLEDEFTRDHIYALAWLLSKDKLEIRVALLYDTNGKLLDLSQVNYASIFHQKVGILYDNEGNIITFSGSVNETAGGWLGNIEEFKVFRNWESAEIEYVKMDLGKFERFWNNQSPRVKVITAPKAIRTRLIALAPVDIETINLTRWYEQQHHRPQLFDHQENAVANWLSSGRRGIFEMATGTGKTFAALGCLESVAKEVKKLVTIIAAPYSHLIQQWKREINIFGLLVDQLIIADATNPKWRDEIANALMDSALPYRYKMNLVILTTHRTFSSSDFTSIMQMHNNSLVTLVIADEVHGLGAEKNKEGLIEQYKFRLGLSATPKRWMDDIGTEAIYDYFTGVVYEFSLRDAISTINPATGQTYLTPYKYKLKFIHLTSEELERYISLTSSIIKKYRGSQNDKSREDLYRNLLFMRADVIKNADNKYTAFEQILDTLGSVPLWTIVYCTSEQIDKVISLLKARGISRHRFTMEEGTTAEGRFNGLSERDFVLKQFSNCTYSVLVAMKCLDEGVDVPPARNSILLASSGNSREYIQRIGRVIRRYPEKTEATIYDVIVAPTFDLLPTELSKIELSIFDKELRRCEEIAATALNSAEAIAFLYSTRERIFRNKN